MASRLVVFAGPGGVGKTTAAAATAAHAAGRGLKTLLVPADGGHSLADVLAVGTVDAGDGPVEVTAGLWAMRPDPVRAAARFWTPVREPAQAALEEAGLDPLGAEDLPGLPGLDELLTLIGLHQQVQDGPWDLVVLDCAPSAQAFRLLSAPDLLGRLLERLLPMERRIARLTSGNRNRGADPLVAAVDRLVGELAAVRTMLSAEGTSVRLVLTPEATVLAGTRRLFTALTMAGFGVDAVVANRVLPDPGPQTSPIEWLDAWLHSQEKILEQATEAFAPVPVLRVEHAAAEPRGLELLAGVGHELYGDASTSTITDPVPTPEAFEIDRTESGFTLRLRIPLARREDLELGRRGDDLVVTADGYRKVLTLPSVLQRCQVQGARLREGTLAVAFVPDPAQFPSRWL